MDTERLSQKSLVQGGAEMSMAPGSRSILLVSPDPALRHRLRVSLSSMRWQVREANGGAEAVALLEQQAAAVLVLDHWLPDLEVGELADLLRNLYPGLEMLRVDGDVVGGPESGARRHELQRALRETTDGGMTSASSGLGALSGLGAKPGVARSKVGLAETSGAEARTKADPVLFGSRHGMGGVTGWNAAGAAKGGSRFVRDARDGSGLRHVVTIDEMIGDSEAMLELASLIRMVAPRSATVLIEGETGTGKEIVAQALHRLSARSAKPFVVLNCAAIPEALLEAELFGHTRGAFTGAVHSRTGRIEAAHGGTLFLDEIGEMPLALQSKMLRFLECGELQRIGDNDTLRVDVRVIAATHQELEERTANGSFRLDLYHRLAVFPIEVPPLRRRKEDLPALAEHFLAELAKHMPRKWLGVDAMKPLLEHHWPGNVRELAHVLERATILAGDSPEIDADHIRLRRATRT